MAAISTLQEADADFTRAINVNALGTSCLLDAVYEYGYDTIKSVVCITSDKVYAESDEILIESSPLGGREIYSASKVCQEEVINAFRNKFVLKGISLCSARGGNVIGGGDWKANRLVPDYMRSYANNESLKLRNTTNVRPFQYILDVLNGYMQLAEFSYKNEIYESYNIGPTKGSAISVQTVVNMLNEAMGVEADIRNMDMIHNEAPFLSINSTKALNDFWCGSKFTTREAVGETAEWYKSAFSGKNMLEYSEGCIERYV